MIQVQSILGIQWQFQIATASCKHRGRELQTQKWISWSKSTEGSPTSWPSPEGTPVGAYTVGSALLQVVRVQLQWWIQHQRRGIGNHQWSDLNDIWMDIMLHLSWDSKAVTVLTFTVLWRCSIEWSIQNFSACRIWTNHFQSSKYKERKPTGNYKSSVKTYPVLFYGIIVEQSAPEV